jgi:fibronectin type 3 domain-containing protein
MKRLLSTRWKRDWFSLGHQRRARKWRVTPAEILEQRCLLSADVLGYHNDNASTGRNLNETVLTPDNVNASTFGRAFTTNLDGNVYAQPLVMSGLNIPNKGIHDVVFAATEHDSLYALDGNTGGVLWQRSFLDIGLPGATSITPLPASVMGATITPDIGITGTPVIDAATQTLYLVATTAETVGGVMHFVQRIHGVDVFTGAEKFGGPKLIGDTTFVNGVYVNNTPLFVNGTGDGNDGKGHVYFNALRQQQRAALTLANGSVYVAWASYLDNGPYHGWIASYDAATLNLNGVFNTTPNAGLGGIWMGGGRLTVDEDGALYFEVGNGGFDGDNSTGVLTGLNPAGFPVKGDYGDSLLKVVVDTVHNSPTNQNINGWGLKVADYFTPFNQASLNAADLDLGSAAPLLLPDEAGSAAHPHLIVASGKEGRIYLLDRDNLGKFPLDQATELTRIVQELPAALHDSLDTAAYFDQQVYYVQGYGGVAQAFAIPNGSAQLSPTPTSVSIDTFAYAGSTPSISANGSNNGIVWNIDRGTNQLRAYAATGYDRELYNSAQAAGNRDLLGVALTFAVPTVANGHVYVGTDHTVIGYGLINPANAAPGTPTGLAATAVSNTQINLNWTNHETSPNTANGYYVEQSPDGTSGWIRIGTAAAGTHTFAVGGLTRNTTYFFRVQAFNVIGTSNTSDPAQGTTTDRSTTLDLSAGFQQSDPRMTLNGGASITASKRLRLTDTNIYQRRSAFTTDPVDVTQFETTFQFQVSNAVIGEGFTFIVQGNGPSALGGSESALGDGTDIFANPGIRKSVAIKFDLNNTIGEGMNSIGLFTNGQAPTTPANDVTSTVDLHSGHVMTVTMSYDGAAVDVTITDTVTRKTVTQRYNVDIPSVVGGATAYVGFTGSTSGLTAIQEILNWTFSSTGTTPPPIPQGLTATLTTVNNGPAATLRWQDVAGELGYKIERRLGEGGTWTQVGTTTRGVLTFTSKGLSTSSHYFYRIRANNLAGDSAYSSEVELITPALPPTPEGGRAASITATSIDLAWDDRADNETGYRILRSSDSDVFQLIATLPPNTTTYHDTGLKSGSKYDYHIQSINESGFSDFTGTTAYTLSPTVSGLTATVRGDAITLTWTAPLTGTTVTPRRPIPLKYNLYRSTTAGGQGSVPYQTDLTATTFVDPNLTPGVKYYYKVTAVVENVDPLPRESVRSAEVSAVAKIPLPAAPNLLSATALTNVGTGQVALTWTPSPGATTYNVYRGLSSNGQSTRAIATRITGATFTDKTATFGKTYFYKVTAVNSSGEGNRSNEQSAASLFHTLVNFTTSTGELAPNAINDTGLTLGSRGNGLRFGWNKTNSANARNRNSVDSPDEAHDSFALLQEPTNNAAVWQINVPNGTYQVTLLAGDPTAIGSVVALRAEGVLAPNGTPTSDAHWVQSTVTVTVADGRLTIDNAPGAIRNLINFIEVLQILP